MLFFIILDLKTEAKSINSSLGIETNYQIGKILKHVPVFNPKINGLSNIVEVSIFKQLDTSKAWHRQLKYPEIGTGLYYVHHFDKDTFGYNIAAFGFFKYPLVRSKVADFYFRIAGGLAYTNKKYHPENNGNNNVIGANINLFAQLRLGLDWKINSKIQLLTAVSYSHYSSSATRLPNLGVNVPSATIGLRYFFNNNIIVLPKKDTIARAKYKNEFSTKFAVAIQDITKTTIDKSYAVFLANFGYARYFRLTNKFYTGTTVEFNYGWKNLYVNKIQEKNTKLPNVATSFSIYAGNEIMIGNVGMFYSLGIYLFNTYKMPMPIYFKIGANYYLPMMGKKKKNQTFLNCSIKAHGGTAQYLETGLGWTIKK